MTVAVVRSKGLIIKNFARFIPDNTTEIICMGRRGIDPLAEEYAFSHKIAVAEYLTAYDDHGRPSPILRIFRILLLSDMVIAFWDGKSNETKFIIDICIKLKMPLRVYMLKKRRK